MSGNLAFHYVCTFDEAFDLIANHTRFWVSNCGCRERKGKCARSRHDLCLMFRDDIDASGSNKHEISPADVRAIMNEAQAKNLVTRPFRNARNSRVTDGICFCCDDCCEYFIKAGETCDKGALIEMTITDLCTQCGECIDVCYFKARSMADGELKVDRDSCYGCGLCAANCPEGCIEMIRRENGRI
jgi:ferredoxin